MQRAGDGHCCRRRSTSPIPDPACDLDYVAERRAAAAISAVDEQRLRLRRPQRLDRLRASGSADGRPAREASSERHRRTSSATRACCGGRSRIPRTPSSTAATTYERLEFLGDSVLSASSSRQTSIESFPDLPEGAHDPHEGLSHRWADRSRRSLAYLGPRPSAAPGRGASAARPTRDSVLEDALEAVIGAVYLDGGLEPALAVASALPRGARSTRTASMATTLDAKTRLQELTQSRRLGLPRYEIVRRERTGARAGLRRWSSRWAAPTRDAARAPPSRRPNRPRPQRRSSASSGADLHRRSAFRRLTSAPLRASILRCAPDGRHVIAAEAVYGDTCTSSRSPQGFQVVRRPRAPAARAGRDGRSSARTARASRTSPTPCCGCSASSPPRRCAATRWRTSSSPAPRLARPSASPRSTSCSTTPTARSRSSSPRSRSRAGCTATARASTSSTTHPAD